MAGVFLLYLDSIFDKAAITRYFLKKKKIYNVAFIWELNHLSTSSIKQ